MKNRYARVLPVDASSYSANSIISLADAARLIAQGVGKSGVSDRAGRDRVRKTIEYAINKTRELGKPSNKGFVFGDLMEWVKKKWPRTFDHIPSNSHITPGVGGMYVHGSKPSAQSIELPTDIITCQEVIRKLHSLISARGAELESLVEEIITLRPDAEKYRQNREKHRSSARTKRPGRRK